MTQNKDPIIPPSVNVLSEEKDSDFLPWWTGVKEISIYLSMEDNHMIDSRFQSKYPVT